MGHLQPLRRAPERQAPEIPSLENAHDSSPDSPAPRFPPTTGLLRDCVWDTLSLSGSFAQGASVWVDTHLAACWGACQKQRQEGGAMFALFLSVLWAPASPEMPIMRMCGPGSVPGAVVFETASQGTHLDHLAPVARGAYPCSPIDLYMNAWAFLISSLLLCL